MTDSYISESRARRRQASGSRPQSTSHTMIQPITVVATNDDDVFTNADESEVREECPVGKLTYYFEQQETESKQVSQHDQINNAFTSVLHSAPGIASTDTNQEATANVVRSFTHTR
jgi:hypothetical protein